MKKNERVSRYFYSIFRRKSVLSTLLQSAKSRIASEKTRKATRIVCRGFLVLLISFSLSPVSNVACAENNSVLGCVSTNNDADEYVSTFSQNDECEEVPGEVIVLLKQNEASNSLSSPSTNEEAFEVLERVANQDIDSSNLNNGDELDISDLKGINVDSAELVSAHTADNGLALCVNVVNPGQKDELISRLNADENVAFAQPNYVYSFTEYEGNSFSCKPNFTKKPLCTLASKVTSSKKMTINDTYSNYLYYLYNTVVFENGQTGERTTLTGANVLDAWKYAEAVDSTSIAVIDSGCDFEHEDLRDNVRADLAYNAANNSTDITDNLGHGTHVCGIAGATVNNVCGVAGTSNNKAKIVPIKVDEKKESSDSSGNAKDYYISTKSLINAYVYLFDLIETGKLTDLHVINISLGYYGENRQSDDYLFHSCIYTMRNKYNVLTVCAGGNGSDTTGIAYSDQPMYPSDYEECFSVTALNPDGTNAIFSDYNMEKDISAPGVELLSTTVPGIDSFRERDLYLVEEPHASYAFLSGTSMASPCVAGIVAYLFALDPTLSVDDVVSIVKDTANPVNPDYNYHTSSQTGSAGAINAAAAVLVVATNKIYAQQ